MPEPTRRISMLFVALVASIVAVSVIQSASAEPTPPSSAFVAIAPCRLFDTRPGTSNVGTRATPLGPGEIHTVDTWGTNGNCTIPDSATAVSMNVVSIEPTASSYLTVFPADAMHPTASSLNWVAGQAPTPNSVTAAVSATGQLGLYNLAGSVHLAVDVVGYFALPGLAAQGPTGPAGATGPAGPAGAPRPTPANEIWVATSGGDFTSVIDALASITDASAGNPYVVRIAPGVYQEPGSVYLREWVDLVGSGEGTILRSDATTGVLRASNVNSTVRDLVVETSGSHGIRIENSPSSTKTVTLSGVDVRVSGTGTMAISITYGRLVVEGVTATVDGDADGPFGLDVEYADLSGRDLDITVSSSITTVCRGLLLSQATVDVRRMSTRAWCDSVALALHALNTNGILRDSSMTATSAGSSRGIFATAGALAFDGVTIAASTGADSIGIEVLSGGRFTVRNAELRGDMAARRSAPAELLVVDSVLVGSTQGMTDRCVNPMNPDLSAYSCPVSLSEA